ncbi:MAG: YegS/Rv2252/BmrU family lipid kinase [Lapillicoccus sp.]
MSGAVAFPRVGLLTNPTAGRGRGAAYGVRAAAAFRAAGHEIVDLSGPDEATAARRAWEALGADLVDVLTVVGGDGMVHLGANLCAGRPIPLAVIAAGTGNDNARELGLPVRDPNAAAALVTAGRTRSVDLGRCTTATGETRWWIGVLGGGFDSVVSERASRMRWPRGPMRYNLAVARELPVFRPIPYVITVDGERNATEAMLVAVANGPAFGGGMRVAPHASYDDGLLDIVILHRVSRAEFVRVFSRVFRGTHVTHPRVEILRGRHVRLEAPGIVTQADGERFEPLPLDLEVVPGALRLILPATGRVGTTHVIDDP